jgi:hypothetical protein
MSNQAFLRQSLLLLTTSFLMLFIAIPKSNAIVALTDRNIDAAVKYGLENRDQTLSSFLGGNWIEGPEGTLLNIYTPYIQLAKFATYRTGYNKASAEIIAKARKKMGGDISYTWSHPTVKFMVSLVGATPEFAKAYYAKIEAVGGGRSTTLYPKHNEQQITADKEQNVTIKPYTAVNAYTFEFDSLYKTDAFKLILYGKNVEPLEFNVQTKNID